MVEVERLIQFLKRLNKLWDDGTIRQIERASDLNFRELLRTNQFDTLKILLEWELCTVKQLRVRAQAVGIENYWLKNKNELIGLLIKNEINRKVERHD